VDFPDFRKLPDWDSKFMPALRHACSRYEIMLHKMEAADSIAEDRETLLNLASRTHDDVDCLLRLQSEAPELLGWLARNLFETNLIVRHILISSENRIRWLAQALQDEQDIMVGVNLVSQMPPPEAEPRWIEIESILARVGVDDRRPLSVKALATAVGQEAEYAALFRIYSKYVHPTSWSINVPRTHREKWKVVLIIVGHLYASDTMDRLAKSFGVSVNDEEVDRILAAANEAQAKLSP